MTPVADAYPADLGPTDRPPSGDLRLADHHLADQHLADHHLADQHLADLGATYLRPAGRHRGDLRPGGRLATHSSSRARQRGPSTSSLAARS